MFGFRRHRRHSLLHLLLALLGIRFLLRGSREDRCQPTDREAYRTKLRSFRQKMRDAFSVWEESEPATEPAPESPAPETKA